MVVVGEGEGERAREGGGARATEAAERVNGAEQDRASLASAAAASGDPARSGRPQGPRRRRCTTRRRWWRRQPRLPGPAESSASYKSCCSVSHTALDVKCRFACSMCAFSNVEFAAMQWFRRGPRRAAVLGSRPSDVPSRGHTARPGWLYDVRHVCDASVAFSQTSKASGLWCSRRPRMTSSKTPCPRRCVSHAA